MKHCLGSDRPCDAHSRSAILRLDDQGDNGDDPGLSPTSEQHLVRHTRRTGWPRWLAPAIANCSVPRLAPCRLDMAARIGLRPIADRTRASTSPGKRTTVFAPTAAMATGWDGLNETAPD